MHIYLIYFIDWDGWRWWWTDFVPEVIHNPVAIKLLMSGLFFNLNYILCMSVFTSITDFVFISYMFRASHLSF